MDDDFRNRLEAIVARNPAVDDPADDDRNWMIRRAAERCDRLIPAEYRSADPIHPDVRGWATAFRTGMDTRRSLLLLGPVGAGKTYEAYGALRIAVTVARPIRWEAGTAADILDALRPRPGTDTKNTFRRYAGAHLLLLDDLGVARPSEWTEETTFRLLDHRYRHHLPTIATTNLAPADLTVALGERIVSRIAQTHTRVVLKGPDRRREPGGEK